jgi:hypothetical protein
MQFREEENISLLCNVFATLGLLELYRDLMSRIPMGIIVIGSAVYRAYAVYTYACIRRPTMQNRIKILLRGPVSRDGDCDDPLEQ